jgi:hypothetical protein
LRLNGMRNAMMKQRNLWRAWMLAWCSHPRALIHARVLIF